MIPSARIEGRILLVRGQKVLLDLDLAELYGVETRTLVQAVKRNISRFPADFMFQLDKGEFLNWRSQYVMSNPTAKMAVRRHPYAFTEQGVAMLSSVLRSNRAVQVNIAIMRAFVKLRQILTHEDLHEQLAALKQECDQNFKVIFDVLQELATAPEPDIPRMGFHSLKREDD